MDFLRSIAEQKIKAAIESGEFDNLPGNGKPLRLDDDSSVPAELRIMHKVLRNANLLPPEMSLRKEIAELRDQLSQCENETDRNAMQQQIHDKECLFEILMDKHRRRRNLK